MTLLQSAKKVKTHTSLAKPFLKWAGGKTQLLEQFELFLPQQLKEGRIEKYFEPFLGGGAVFFDLIKKYSVNEVFLNDINQDLVLAYQVIKNNPYGLIKKLSELEKKYHKSYFSQREEIFYKIRENYNKQRLEFDYKVLSLKECTSLSQDSLLRVSWLIFLNKTCFNGLYRTNRQGEFNVPFGKYKNPKICDDNNILEVAQILQNVTLVSGNYNSLDCFIDNQSFVYLDPPYRPINKTSSFTTYAKSGFNDQNQIELSKYYKHLSEVTRAKVMLSNSNPHNTNETDNFFHELYREYYIHEVFASRMVNSDAEKRGKITELLITNY
jgi:DNA adenine methylase